MEILIHLTSLTLALAAATESLRLSRLTGKNHAWLYISAGLMLLSVKRLIEMYLAGTGELPVSNADILADLLGLAMTVLYLLGIHGMRAVFEAHLDTERALQQELDDLHRFERLTVGRELRMQSLVAENATLQDEIAAIKLAGRAYHEQPHVRA